jgi:D-glycero-alpha-D-manno-heptose-7-phosphate kinase
MTAEGRKARFRERLEAANGGKVTASAPCRIDMGGTLDISTFHLPLRHLNPCTFNIALDLRTTVRVLPHDVGRIRISSRGFDDAEFPADAAPFDHPMGLMFAVATYFGASGVHIDIASGSPPRSALGGSSVAACALAAAFASVAEDEQPSPAQIAGLAHALEASVAGVPCGFQDQLAAVYGGVNAWYWPVTVGDPPFRQETVVEKDDFGGLENRLLVAYGGIPHESKDVNGRWVRGFLSGNGRNNWRRITELTHRFVAAIKKGNDPDAVEAMNAETAIRREMTPDVVDDLGGDLIDEAIRQNCGARFTGAGGGGCLWAVGEPSDIDALRSDWLDLLEKREGARLLEARIDGEGLICSTI